jgi:hypothetical protein
MNAMLCMTSTDLGLSLGPSSESPLNCAASSDQSVATRYEIQAMRQRLAVLACCLAVVLAGHTAEAIGSQGAADAGEVASLGEDADREGVRLNLVSHTASNLRNFA